MAFPYVSSKGFETGSNAEFDSESDSANLLDFPHYRTTVAAHNVLPYSGAYCARVNISGTGTADAEILETDDFDMASDVTRYLGFALMMGVPGTGNNFTMADADRFGIMAITASGTKHVALDFRRDGSSYELVVAQNSSGTNITTTAFNFGEWHWLEFALAYDGAGDASGTIDFYIDGGQVGSQIASLTQATSTDVRFGLQEKDAGTTAGTFFIDNITFDDTNRVRPYPGHGNQRLEWPNNRHWVDGRNHHVVGPGVANIYLTGSSTDADLLVYDSENATNNGTHLLAHIRTAADDVSRKHRVHFNKGLYLVPSGTNPQAYVDVIDSAYTSAGMIKNLASRGSP